MVTKTTVLKVQLVITSGLLLQRNFTGEATPPPPTFLSQS